MGRLPLIMKIRALKLKVEKQTAGISATKSLKDPPPSRHNYLLDVSLKLPY